jgi:hypothetical protein
MSLVVDVAKGTRAQQLLDSDIYRDALVGVRNGILEAWATSPIRDQEGQHELRLMLKLLDDLQGHIISMANTGKLAKAQIEHENKLKEMAKKAVDGLSSLIGK